MNLSLPRVLEENMTFDKDFVNIHLMSIFPVKDS